MCARYSLHAALLSAFILVILIILGGAAVPQYDHASQFISELGERGAPYEYLVRFAGFLPIWILSCIYLFGAYHQLPKSKVVNIGLVGIFIYAFGYLAAAIFPCDPGCRPAEPSLSQGLHNLFGYAGYLVSPAFLFLFGLESRRWPKQRHLSFTAFLCALTALLGLLTLVPDSPWVGISQRLIEAAVWIWIVLSAFYVRFYLPSKK